MPGGQQHREHKLVSISTEWPRRGGWAVRRKSLAGSRVGQGKVLRTGSRWVWLQQPEQGHGEGRRGQTAGSRQGWALRQPMQLA